MYILGCIHVVVCVILTSSRALAHPTQVAARYQPSEPVYEAGPVMPQNFPDPCIVEYEGMWYSFATQTNPVPPATTPQVHIQIAQSPDFKTWNIVNNTDGSQRDALVQVPAWVNMTRPGTWAPDVNQLDDGSFLMYFAGFSDEDSSLHCVGAGTSNTILGPYAPLSTPLACPLSQGGANDPSGFKDWTEKSSGWGYGNGNEDNAGWEKWHNGNHTWSPSNTFGIGAPGVSPQWSEGGKGGQRYLCYKIEGNAIGHGGPCGNTVRFTSFWQSHCHQLTSQVAPIVPTPLVCQAVAADGITIQSEPFTLIDNNGLNGTDEGVTEAPSLVKAADGNYVIFFSSGCITDNSYTVNYATSTSGIKGPYARQPTGPLLETGDYGLISPGGADVLWDARHIVFHADLGNTSTIRQLYVGEIEIVGTEAFI